VEPVWKKQVGGFGFPTCAEPLFHQLSSLTILADQLFKDIQGIKTMHENETLTGVMDSIALFGHANWKLNMTGREIVKPDLNPAYTICPFGYH